MMLIEPILADGLVDLLAKGIPVILFVLWLIGQAVSEKQKQAKKAPPRQGRPIVPQPQPKARRAATDIEDEIDAFLRRAAEKKGQPQPRREETEILLPQKEEARKAQAQPAVMQRPPRKQPLARPLSQRTGEVQPPPPPQPPAARPAAAAAAGAAAAGAARSSPVRVPDSVRMPLSLPLSQRQPHLGEVVALADDKLEAHLQQVFDHQLGRLRHRTPEEQRQVSGSPIARSVLDLLKNPQGVQQMMVINEIMRRPEM